jgi:transposase
MDVVAGDRAKAEKAADLLTGEVTNYRASNKNALEAQRREEASHEACCHRSRESGIAGVHPSTGRNDHRRGKAADAEVAVLDDELGPEPSRDGNLGGSIQAGGCSEAGHEVRVVPATLVRTLGVGARGLKNDQRDARTLSEVSCRIDLPSVHIPSIASRELKSVCGSREILVAMRTTMINNVRGWLRTQLWRLRSGSTATFHERVRAHATSIEAILPEHIERQLRMIESVSTEIRGADTHVRQVAKRDAICRALMTVPGVGPITAVRFRAALDDVTRFASAHRVQSYLGLTPGENSSSERQQRMAITKAGASAPRKMLIQSAWATFRRYPNDPMVKWAKKIAERRGVFIAIVALARKLAGIMFAIWRDGTTYRSERSAAS